MKNITLKIDDETHRQARIFAAQHGTSVSALVREYLVEKTSHTAPDKETKSSLTSHEKRVADLDTFFAEMDAKAKTLTPRSESLSPMTREEIYAERLR